MQPILQTTYYLNNKPLVRHSSHDLNDEPFNDQTGLDHSNTKLIHYSDPDCFIFQNVPYVIRILRVMAGPDLDSFT